MYMLNTIMRNFWCILRHHVSQFSMLRSNPKCCQITWRFLHNYCGQFQILDAIADVNSATYLENFAHNSVLVKKLESALTQVTLGGDARAVERHTGKNRKLLVKDRLALLFDDVSEVLELSQLCGMGMKYGDIPRAGIVSG